MVPLSYNYSNIMPLSLAGAKRERELPRVDESSLSTSFGLKLSCALGDSHPLSSNLNLLKFLLRVAESFLSFGPRLRVA